ncbi:MAG: PepSY domain-containing protein [Azonexus sp.]|nr:PepSY domain-containing protein [Azonexus sp.]
MKYFALRFLLGFVFGVSASMLAQASSPAEKIVCTQQPRATWMPEAKIKEIFGEKNFALAKLKVSRGNCYEFYAVNHDGSIVEAYYHPVSGEVVRYNRVTATTTESNTPTPSSAR